MSDVGVLGHRRLLYAPRGTAVATKLLGQPVDDPLPPCHIRSGSEGRSYASNVSRANGSLSHDRPDISQSSVIFFSSLYRSDPALYTANFSEHVRLFCGERPSCPEVFSCSLARPAARVQFFDLHGAMKAGSASGPVGLPTGFYIVFWDILANSLVLLVNHFLNTGEALYSFRCGRVVLLLKDRSPSDFVAWRPNTLLNVDYSLRSGDERQTEMPTACIHVLGTSRVPQCPSV